MKLASILNPDLIICEVEGSSREEIYGNMLKHILKHADLELTHQELLDNLIEREDSIGIPYEGIALPHARDSRFNDLYVAIGTLKEPVKMKSGDLKESSIVIMSFISHTTSDTYLKSLAAFARYLSKPENVKKICESSTGAEIVALLEADNVKLKNEITAEDVMKTNFSYLHPDASLSEALDKFTHDEMDQLPVIDTDGKLLGIVDATEIIRKHIPEYILMMDNLKFLTSFEPFDKIFKEENTLSIKDFISKPKAIIPATTPLIQLTVSLVKKEAPSLYVVTDESGKLAGIITIQQLIHKVLRG
jgi:mannitol/fructose-specific phosphotransferase system IIA component (Ntr-type)